MPYIEVNRKYRSRKLIPQSWCFGNKCFTCFISSMLKSSATVYGCAINEIFRARLSRNFKSRHQLSTNLLSDFPIAVSRNFPLPVTWFLDYMEGRQEGQTWNSKINKSLVYIQSYADCYQSNTVGIVAMWCTSYALTLNPAKTVVVLFTISFSLFGTKLCAMDKTWLNRKFT